MSNQSINKITLLGKVGNKPVVSGEGKQPFAALSLATHQCWKDKEGQKQEKTTWHKVIFFGKVAEFIKTYADAGSRLLVEGELEHFEWHDNDGCIHKDVRIVAKEWPILFNFKEKATNEQLVDDGKYECDDFLF